MNEIGKLTQVITVVKNSILQELNFMLKIRSIKGLKEYIIRHRYL